jgi:predicted RNA-binding protein with PUA-like domain
MTAKKGDTAKPAVRSTTSRPAHWLMKTEPESFSFTDLMKTPNRTTGWEGVRNYQARNFMRDEMRPGDRVFIYHSSAEPPGVAGVAEVVGTARPDPTAFDPKDPHYDAGSKREAPMWMMVDVRGIEALERLVSLEELRANPALTGMRLLQKGNRLSIVPVTAEEWREIRAMAKRKPR